MQAEELGQRVSLLRILFLEVVSPFNWPLHSMLTACIYPDIIIQQTSCTGVSLPHSYHERIATHGNINNRDVTPLE